MRKSSIISRKSSLCLIYLLQRSQNVTQLPEMPSHAEGELPHSFTAAPEELLLQTFSLVPALTEHESKYHRVPAALDPAAQGCS